MVRQSKLLPACAIAACLLSTSLAAGETRYLIRNERFCSTSDNVCIRGTISYDVNPRLLRLRGRVQRATGPGLLRIRVIGTNQHEHQRYAEMEIWLRGHYSEIINFKMIPDHPDVANWEVATVLFEPDDGRRER